jgi:S-DNA-T family DNA segregation ATPase FtsK/SpoIIIE
MAFPLFAPRRPLVETQGRGDELPSNTRSATVLGAGAGAYPRGREIAALLFWTVTIFLVLALGSYAGDPSAGAVGAEAHAPVVGANWVGAVGEWAARGVVSLVGVTAWLIPAEALLLGIPFIRGKKSNLTPTRLAGDFLILLVTAALVEVGWPGKLAFGRHIAAGLVGELFGELARSLFSTVGSFLVGFAIVGLILIVRAAFSFIALMNLIARLTHRGAQSTAERAKSVAGAWKEARDLDREKVAQEKAASAPKIDRDKHDDALVAILPPESDDDDPDTDVEDAPVVVSKTVEETSSALSLAKRMRGKVAIESIPPPPPTSKKKATSVPEVETESEDAEPTLEPKKRGRKKKAEPEAELEESGPTVDESAESSVDAHDLRLDETPSELPEVSMGAPEKPKKKAAPPPKKKEEAGPTIVDTSAALEQEKPTDKELKKKDKVVPATGHGFRLPSMDFLAQAKVDPSLVIDEVGLRKSADLLVKTLADYKVTGTVEEIHPGPVVTTFEVAPVAGTKVARVASLADDLALALAKKVRIVAPIPGKNRIGFELPNEKRLPVNLRDLIDDRRFQTLDAPLPVVLGRDIVGNPVYADLASMPHVIVAGATGAGKSVGLNVMLTSLLYRRTPEELRLLMIDPKVVELAPFDRIPHMLLPVVTDMKQASNALKWAVDEMERRYQLFADAGTKNITTYNAWCGRVKRGEIRNPLPKQVMAKDHNGFEEAVNVAEFRPGVSFDDGEGESPIPDPMPFIVIVVDEFADLMMQQGKEVETAVARLAQKARAAGMHVILATQRPSVDVITGMIKANFPTRIAFRVAQKIDSRTILDEQGAEHLLGRGDMLVKLNGQNDTKRVQCPWVSEEEVQAVTDFLRLQGEPVYDENILKPRDDDAEGNAEEDAEQDAMYDDAVRIVAETRRCSTSWLQRKLGLGYNRAARIVETMERRGVVGPPNGSKDREVLLSAL